MNGACLILVYYATINCNNKNYKPKQYKVSCKKVLGSATVTPKNNLTYHCTLTNTTPSYQQNEATEPTDILKIKRNIQVL